jgi:hypothetical protein
MILCEWDASEGHPGQSCVHLYARILSTSFTSVSIFSVCCYSSVSISIISGNEYRVHIQKEFISDSKSVLVEEIRRVCRSRNFPLLELCSICFREGLGRSKPATNPWNKHNNNDCGDSYSAEFSRNEIPFPTLVLLICLLCTPSKLCRTVSLLAGNIQWFHFQH